MRTQNPKQYYFPIVLLAATPLVSPRINYQAYIFWKTPNKSQALLLHEFHQKQASTTAGSPLLSSVQENQTPSRSSARCKERSCLLETATRRMQKKTGNHVLRKTHLQIGYNQSQRWTFCMQSPQTCSLQRLLASRRNTRTNNKYILRIELISWVRSQLMEVISWAWKTFWFKEIITFKLLIFCWMVILFVWRDGSWQGRESST